ncbi:hypothetical protein HK102_010532, partial [Quaeritorhiza haematococci]
VEDVCSDEFFQFRDALTGFCADLAKLIVRDGEGATKFVEIRVEGAHTIEEAKQIASTIATSPLVKTAIYGRDANWGRIICAVGYSGVPVDPNEVNLYLSKLPSPSPNNADTTRTEEDTANNPLAPRPASDMSPVPENELHLFKDGQPYDVDEERAADILEGEDILIRVDLGLGDAKYTEYTCDFSTEYVHINADYRS